MKYHPELILDEVFRRALAVLGPDRVLFGTDSSYFPRGWHKAIYDEQRLVVERRALAPQALQASIFDTVRTFTGGAFQDDATLIVIGMERTGN